MGTRRLIMKLRLYLGMILVVGSNLGLLSVVYTPVGGAEKQYKTLPEKKELFEKVGCKYFDALKIEYPEFSKLHAKKSAKYQDNKKVADQYTQQYASLLTQDKKAPMYLAWISKDVGYGVFAAKPIKKDAWIGQYAGVVREIDNGKDNLDYAWVYSLNGIDGKQLVIDAKRQGNELRFINHATDPNTVCIDVLGDDGIFHMGYIALKDIKKDEQLTVSYGNAYFTSRSMPVVVVA